MRHAAWIASALIALGVLGGCKGSHNQNSAQARMLNAVVDAEPLNMNVDDSAKATGVALGSASSFTEITSGTRDVKIVSSTTQAVLLEKSLAFQDGTNDTVLVYGKRASMLASILTDETTVISSGHLRVRVVNLAPDTGIVDVYIGAGDISTLPAAIPGAGAGNVTASAEISPGAAPVTITISGTQDVIFTSAPQTFTAGTYVTVIVVPSAGGKLVSAILLTQGGGTTFLQNPIARVKATNAIGDSAAGYNFRADGAPVLLNVPFAASSTYINIASGNHTLQLEASNVPGTIAASLTKSLDGAHDYSLVALGTSAAPQLTAITDDNSSPPTGLAKLRFINAMSGSSAVDVQVNFAGELSGLAFGTASSYYNVAPSLTYTITFASPGGLSVLATATPIEIDNGGVYTAYLMGASGAPQIR
ncbi:MAG TPA: DUF4397 domain-containing protein, partial [Usitatibacter sp.]|nr:DUF4397 domain-containing protein [Usitatibacter sp.]